MVDEDLGTVAEMVSDCKMQYNKDDDEEWVRIG